MTALKTVFAREELLADDYFARPQIEAGYRLHGGFDAAGKYVSPRVKHRWLRQEWQKGRHEYASNG